jgi:hypothetical protein
MVQGRKAFKRWSFNYDRCDLKYSEIAFRMGMTEVTIRNWFKIGVPDQYVAEFRAITGLRGKVKKNG